MMKVTPTNLPEVLLIEPTVVGDEREFLLESWSARTFAEVGIKVKFVQDNHSRSSIGVLRGLHYQIEQSQGKLIRVLSGGVFDVAVDIRRSSPRFGQWVGVELTAQNRHMLWIPPGFAHGFLALKDNTDTLYSCSDFYSPQHERSILWSDPEIGIEWPLHGLEPTLSGKDAVAPTLAEADVYP
jgi:dTDP-4-dehydrorhamnose 3,5-epimerase